MNRLFIATVTSILTTLTNPTSAAPFPIFLQDDLVTTDEILGYADGMTIDGLGGTATMTLSTGMSNLIVGSSGNTEIKESGVTAHHCDLALLTITATNNGRKVLTDFFGACIENSVNVCSGNTVELLNDAFQNHLLYCAVTQEISTSGVIDQLPNHTAILRAPSILLQSSFHGWEGSNLYASTASFSPAISPQPFQVQIEGEPEPVDAVELTYNGSNLEIYTKLTAGNIELFGVGTSQKTIYPLDSVGGEREWNIRLGGVTQPEMGEVTAYLDTGEIFYQADTTPSNDVFYYIVESDSGEIAVGQITINPLLTQTESIEL